MSVTRDATRVVRPRSDPFLQLDDLEAGLPLGLARWLDLAIAGDLQQLLRLSRFHRKPPFE
jgi:hypothetical protein